MFVRWLCPTWKGFQLFFSVRFHTGLFYAEPKVPGRALVHFSHFPIGDHPTGFHPEFLDIFRDSARPALLPGGPLLWRPVSGPVPTAPGLNC